MPEPIRLTLPLYQVARFAQIKAEQERLVKRIDELTIRYTEGLTVAIGAHCDPATVADWNVEIVGHEIVCTPPSAPALVKEA